MAVAATVAATTNLCSLVFLWIKKNGLPRAFVTRQAVGVIGFGKDDVINDGNGDGP